MLSSTAEDLAGSTGLLAMEEGQGKFGGKRKKIKELLVWIYGLEIASNFLAIFSPLEAIVA